MLFYYSRITIKCIYIKKKLYLQLIDMVILNNNDSFNIKDVKTVNANEAMNDPNGIYLDFDSNNIPDLCSLTNDIITFLEYIITPEMQKLENENKDAFSKHLENKFSDFTLNYITIYKMLLDKDKREENTMKLLNLIEILKEVKKGSKNMESEFDKFKETLNEEYIYSKFGGKENFEKKIKERSLKKRRKKGKNF